MDVPAIMESLQEVEVDVDVDQDKPGPQEDVDADVDVDVDVCWWKGLIEKGAAPFCDLDGITAPTTTPLTIQAFGKKCKRAFFQQKVEKQQYFHLCSVIWMVQLMETQTQTQTKAVTAQQIWHSIQRTFENAQDDESIARWILPCLEPMDLRLGIPLETPTSKAKTASDDDYDDDDSISIDEDTDIQYLYRLVQFWKRFYEICESTQHSDHHPHSRPIKRRKLHSYSSSKSNNDNFDNLLKGSYKLPAAYLLCSILYDCCQPADWEELDKLVHTSSKCFPSFIVDDIQAGLTVFGLQCTYNYHDSNDNNRGRIPGLTATRLLDGYLSRTGECILGVLQQATQLDYYPLRAAICEHLLEPIYGEDPNISEELEASTIQACSDLINKEHPARFLKQLAASTISSASTATNTATAITSNHPKRHAAGAKTNNYYSIPDRITSPRFPLLTHIDIWILQDNIWRVTELVRVMDADPNLDGLIKDEAYLHLWQSLLRSGKIFLDGNQDRPGYSETRELLYTGVVSSMGTYGRGSMMDMYAKIADKVWQHVDATMEERRYVMVACQHTLLRLLFKCRGFGGATVAYFLNTAIWPVPLSCNGQTDNLDAWAAQFLQQANPIPESLLNEEHILDLNRLTEDAEPVVVEDEEDAAVAAEDSTQLVLAMEEPDLTEPAIQLLEDDDEEEEEVEFVAVYQAPAAPEYEVLGIDDDDEEEEEEPVDSDGPLEDDEENPIVENYQDEEAPIEDSDEEEEDDDEQPDVYAEEIDEDDDQDEGSAGGDAEEEQQNFVAVIIEDSDDEEERDVAEPEEVEDDEVKEPVEYVEEPDDDAYDYGSARNSIEAASVDSEEEEEDNSNLPVGDQPVEPEADDEDQPPSPPIYEPQESDENAIRINAEAEAEAAAAIAALQGSPAQETSYLDCAVEDREPIDVEISPPKREDETSMGHEDSTVESPERVPAGGVAEAPLELLASSPENSIRGAVADTETAYSGGDLAQPMEDDAPQSTDARASKEEDDHVDSNATDDEQERVQEVEKADTEVAAVGGGEFGDTTDEDDVGNSLANLQAQADRKADALRAPLGYTSQLEEGYEPEDTHGYTEEEVSEAVHTEDEQEERVAAQNAREADADADVDSAHQKGVEPVQHSGPHSSDDMDEADEHTEHEEDLGAESSELEETEGVREYAEYSPSVEDRKDPTTLWQYAQSAQRRHDEYRSSVTGPCPTHQVPSAPQNADEEVVGEQPSSVENHAFGDKSIGLVEPAVEDKDVGDTAQEAAGAQILEVEGRVVKQDAVATGTQGAEIRNKLEIIDKSPNSDKMEKQLEEDGIEDAEVTGVKSVEVAIEDREMVEGKESAPIQADEEDSGNFASDEDHIEGASNMATQTSMEVLESEDAARGYNEKQTELVEKDAWEADHDESEEEKQPENAMEVEEHVKNKPQEESVETFTADKPDQEVREEASDAEMDTDEVHASTEQYCEPVEGGFENGKHSEGEEEDAESENRNGVDDAESENPESVEDAQSENQNEVDDVQSENPESVEDAQSENQNEFDDVQNPESVEDAQSENQNEVDDVQNPESAEDAQSENQNEVDDVQNPESVEDAQSENQNEVDDVQSENQESVKDAQSENQNEVDDVQSENQESVEDAQSENQNEVDDVQSVNQESVEDAQSENQNEVDDVQSENQEEVEDVQIENQNEVDDAQSENQNEVDDAQSENQEEVEVEDAQIENEVDDAQSENQEEVEVEDAQIENQNEVDDAQGDKPKEIDETQSENQNEVEDTDAATPDPKVIAEEDEADTKIVPVLPSSVRKSSRKRQSKRFFGVEGKEEETKEIQSSGEKEQEDDEVSVNKEPDEEPASGTDDNESVASGASETRRSGREDKDDESLAGGSQSSTVSVNEEKEEATPRRRGRARKTPVQEDSSDSDSEKDEEEAEELPAPRQSGRSRKTKTRDVDRQSVASTSSRRSTRSTKKADAEEAEETPAKRKSGRPRKTQAKETPAKRKPGRARKTQAEETPTKKTTGRSRKTQSEETPAKKKPGRTPRKIEVEEAPAKRKPARPRKTEAGETPPKRKSGRTRKTQVEEIPAKRKPVRTRKTANQDDDNESVASTGSRRSTRSAKKPDTEVMEEVKPAPRKRGRTRKTANQDDDNESVASTSSRRSTRSRKKAEEVEDDTDEENPSPHKRGRPPKEGRPPLPRSAPRAGKGTKKKK